MKIFPQWKAIVYGLLSCAFLVLFGYDVRNYNFTFALVEILLFLVFLCLEYIELLRTK